MTNDLEIVPALPLSQQSNEDGDCSPHVSIPQPLALFSSAVDMFYYVAVHYNRHLFSICKSSELVHLFVKEQRWMSLSMLTCIVGLRWHQRLECEATARLFSSRSVVAAVARGENGSVTRIAKLLKLFRLNGMQWLLQTYTEHSCLLRAVQKLLRSVPFNVLMGLSPSELQQIMELDPEVFTGGIDHYFWVVAGSVSNRWNIAGEENTCVVSCDDLDMSPRTVVTWSKKTALAMTYRIPKLSADVKDLIADYLVDTSPWDGRRKALKVVKQQRWERWARRDYFENFVGFSVPVRSHVPSEEVSRAIEFYERSSSRESPVFYRDLRYSVVLRQVTFAILLPISRKCKKGRTKRAARVIEHSTNSFLSAGDDNRIKEKRVVFRISCRE